MYTVLMLAPLVSADTHAADARLLQTQTCPATTLEVTTLSDGKQLAVEPCNDGTLPLRKKQLRCNPKDAVPKWEPKTGPFDQCLSEEDCTDGFHVTRGQMLVGPAEELALEGLTDSRADEARCRELCAQSQRCRAATMTRTNAKCPKGKQAQVLLQQLLALSTITPNVSTTQPPTKPTVSTTQPPTIATMAESVLGYLGTLRDLWKQNNKGSSRRLRNVFKSSGSIFAAINKFNEALDNSQDAIEFATRVSNNVNKTFNKKFLLNLLGDLSVKISDYNGSKITDAQTARDAVSAVLQKLDKVKLEKLRTLLKTLAEVVPTGKERNLSLVWKALKLAIDQLSKKGGPSFDDWVSYLLPTGKACQLWHEGSLVAWGKGTNDVLLEQCPEWEEEKTSWLDKISDYFF